MTSTIIISALQSGAGKTTVSAGLMAAYRAKGVAVRGAKIGPDFIDPSFHRVATGADSYNIDTFLTGVDGAKVSATLASSGADLLIIEGVMGLFDGTRLDTVVSDLNSQPTTRHSRSLTGSTAEVAHLLGATVILVIDCSGASDSVAAQVLGVKALNPNLRIGGVIANRIGSENHAKAIRLALAENGIKLLGTLPKESEISMPARHLGLVPAQERLKETKAAIERISNIIRERFDLEGIASIASPLPKVSTHYSSPRPKFAPIRLGIATGRAFTFSYVENWEILTAFGAELVEFDPVEDRSLPSDLSGLFIGGGFPEVYLNEIHQNRPLLQEITSFIRSGGATWAECAGHMLLGTTLDGLEMTGVHDGRAAMAGRLTLGYRLARASRNNPLFKEGELFRAHEYHYSEMEGGGRAIQTMGRGGEGASGVLTDSLLSSYLHIHLGGHTNAAKRFLMSAARSTRDD